jgi:hypothetical protein
MSYKNRSDKAARRWFAWTYESMRKRRCDLPRRWLKGKSRIRRTMYWADIAKQRGAEAALYDRKQREPYLI